MVNTAGGYALTDGLHVFPLHSATPDGCSCGKATCDRRSWGKHPRTPNGLKDATTDAEQIRVWWKKWPHANIGVRTGTDTGIVMIGPDGEQGIADLKELEQDLGPLPPTRKAKSGSGGEHYYFRWPADGLPIKNRKNHLGTKIDVRGDGGYFVAPPSVNGFGRYEWADADAGFTELPPAWAEWCRTDDRKAHAAPTPSAFAATVTSGTRTPVIERARKYLAKMDPAVSGQRGHDALFAAARVLVWGFRLSDADAYDLLANEYNPRCLPPWSEKEIRHKVSEANSKPSKMPRGWLLSDEEYHGVSYGQPHNAGPRVSFNGQYLGGDTSTASTAAEEETSPVKPAEWPDPMGSEAFHGLAGEIVDVLDGGSEADRVALLGLTLAMGGSVFGREPHYRVSGSYHRCNLNLVIVGMTGHGRKGTAGDMVRMAFEGVDDDWLNGRVMNGLSSGEGLLWAIRDPITKRVEVKQRGCAPTYEDVEADPGVSDKRLLVIEPEYANVLKVQERQGSTLSPIIRMAWDSPPVMQTMTKNNPAKASHPHVSIIGHITGTEFTRCLPSTEVANGGANRGAILCVRRSKVLPDGGQVDPDRLAIVREKLRRAVAFAKAVGEVKRHPDATPLWHGVYELLTSGGGGLHGSLTARAAPIVLRVAMVYALLDRSRLIRPAHLMAAIAFWDYCDRSTAFLFADRTGNPLADEIRDLLRASPSGMTRTEIQTALGKHSYGDRLTQALQSLELAKLARREKEQTGGRAAERWRATAGAGVESQLLATARRLYAECGESGKSGERPTEADSHAEEHPPFAAFTAYTATTDVGEGTADQTSTASTAFAAPKNWKRIVLETLEKSGSAFTSATEVHARVARTEAVILATIETALAELVDGGEVEVTEVEGPDIDPETLIASPGTKRETMYRATQMDAAPPAKPKSAPWAKGNDPLTDTAALLAAVRKAGWTEPQAVKWLEDGGELVLCDDLGTTTGPTRQKLLDHLAGLSRGGDR